MFDLSPERVRQVLHYEPATGIMTWIDCSKHHRGLNGSIAGTARANHTGKLYQKITIDKRKYGRSRLAFVWMTGRWPEHCIDHINGDSLDDRWENLREATVTQNAWNHRHRRRAQSDLPMGVRRLGSRFQARLAVNKRMIHLGSYDTPEAASTAYQTARREHYGQFA